MVFWETLITLRKPATLSATQNPSMAELNIKNILALVAEKNENYLRIHYWENYLHVIVMFFGWNNAVVYNICKEIEYLHERNAEIENYLLIVDIF